MHIVKPYHELIADAREAEANSEYQRAIKIYLGALKMEPHLELPYNRLMILYRREKDYEKELKIINQGLQAFTEFYRKRSEKLIGKHGTAAKLSAALARSLGQKGLKGSVLSLPEPIPKWTLRKKIVEKKLGY